MTENSIKHFLYFVRIKLYIIVVIGERIHEKENYRDIKVPW